MDTNLTITSVVALCAIASPLLTTMIDNKHKIKMKNIDNYELAKRNVLNEFLVATINCVTNIEAGRTKSSGEPTVEQLKVFLIACNKLTLYFPKINFKNLDTLKSQILSGEYSFIQKHLQKILIDLSNNITIK